MLSGSMTGAARLINISQPAITRLIRDLELELDLQLFRRGGGRITPTAEGQQLYREVERHFAGTARIRQSARAIRELNAGHLHIGAMLTLSTGCLPTAVHRFLQRHPDVMISVHSDSSLNIVDMVRHGQLDLGLCSVPGEPIDIEHDPFAPVDAVCIMPRGHPLARKKVVNIADLQDESFISLGTSSLLRLRVEEALRAANVQPRVRLGTLYSSTVVGYVGAGIGVAVTDPFALFGKGGHDIIAKPFRPRLKFQFSAIYQHHAGRSRLAVDFVHTLRHVINSELRRVQPEPPVRRVRQL